MLWNNASYYRKTEQTCRKPDIILLVYFELYFHRDARGRNISIGHAYLAWITEVDVGCVCFKAKIKIQKLQRENED